MADVSAEKSGNDLHLGNNVDAPIHLLATALSQEDLTPLRILNLILIHQQENIWRSRNDQYFIYLHLFKINANKADHYSFSITPWLAHLQKHHFLTSNLKFASVTQPNILVSPSKSVLIHLN